jgi:phosphoribosylanthranilate isomerase
MVHVKICGIMSLGDALYAAEQGADAVGFVFYKKSPRYIDPVEAGRIVAALPPFVTPVGVFADDDEESVKHAVNESGVTVLQFHGTEKPGFCASFGMPYVKAFRIRGMESLEGMEQYREAAAFLLDAYSEKALGGTGTSFNWDTAVFAKKYGRIVLAGGLTPLNVAEAVRHVTPYAVDVSSGVEESKGKKDHAAVRAFIANAKGCAVS